MKFFPICATLLLMINTSTFCQNLATSSKSDDSLKIAYIKTISAYTLDGGPFFKTIFMGENGEIEIAMIQKISLKLYLHDVKKQNSDSIENIIIQNILRNRAYPLKDSLLIIPVFSGLKINRDSLSALEKLPLKKVVAKYFDWGGSLKMEYRELRFLLACYFFEKCVVLFGVGSLEQTIDYGKTKMLLGDNWFR